MSSSFLKPTATERKTIRSVVFSGGATIDLADNGDGTWFADIYGVIVEAGSPAELLREIATVLEEA